MKKLFAIVLLSIHFQKSNAQHLVQHALHHEVYATRTGFFDNLSYHATIAKWQIGVGFGFNWKTLIQSAFFAPHINVNTYYLIVKNERLHIGLGLDYFFDFRSYATNKNAISHALFYGYSLEYGKSWRLVHRLGVGGDLYPQFPKGNTVVLDVELLIGAAYAF